VDATIPVRAHEVIEAPIVNTSIGHGPWRTLQMSDLSRAERRVWVEIPMRFTEMQLEAPDLALAWRLQTREIFESYFARGYRAVDFELQEDQGLGRYLLALD
jgi:predicted GNAT superfamily acetyltransferase